MMKRRELMKGGAVLSLASAMGLRAGAAAAEVAGTEVYTAGEQGGALSEKVGELPGAFILDFNALGGTGNLNFDNG